MSNSVSTGKLVAIVDDEMDITELFQDALSYNIENTSVVSFNDTTLALEHYSKQTKLCFDHL